MLVAVPKETFPGERRVCLIPADLPRLAKAGIEVLVERGAGVAAGFPDALYEDKGAKLADSREELWSCGDVIATVRTLGASPECMEADLKCVRPGQLLVGALPVDHYFQACSGRSFKYAPLAELAGAVKREVHVP